MRPWTFFTVAIAGWRNCRQQDVIEYLKEENRVLREKLGRKRLLLTVEQKRRLAVKGKTIGRKLLPGTVCANQEQTAASRLIRPAISPAAGRVPPTPRRERASRSRHR